MSKAEFRYEGLEAYDYSVDDRCYYCEFAVYQNNGWIEGPLVQLITNNRLEGLFKRVEDNGLVEYRQIKGTCEFAMPETKAAARAMLRRMAKKAVSEHIQFMLDEHRAGREARENELENAYDYESDEFGYLDPLFDPDY